MSLLTETGAGKVPPAYTLVDGHAHLEEIGHLGEVIARAGKAGVSAIVAVGSDYPSCKRVLEIAGLYGKTAVYPALGIHPWNLKAETVEATLRFVEENMGKAVAVGEIGLDYWLKEARKDPAKIKLQQDVFTELLALAKKHQKPAIIHARGSWEDALRLVLDSKIEKAVFHWFSGPMDILRNILASGHFISATPAAEYSQNHRMAVFHTPLQSLLLETDTPVEYQGKKSEPADVLKTLEAVSRIKKEEKGKVADITTHNASRLFHLHSSG